MPVARLQICFGVFCFVVEHTVPISLYKHQDVLGCHWNKSEQTLPMTISRIVVYKEGNIRVCQIFRENIGSSVIDIIDCFLTVPLAGQ